MRARLLGLAALVAMFAGVLAGGAPVQAAPGPQSIQGDVPKSGVGLAQLTEVLAPDQVVTALATRGCVATGVWISQAGTLQGYVSGAPSFVNAGFPGTLAAGQGILFRCSGETPAVVTPAPSTPTTTATSTATASPTSTATASPTSTATTVTVAARECMPGTTVRRTGTGALAHFQSLRSAGTLRGQVVFLDYADARGTAADETGARGNASASAASLAALSGGRLSIQYDFASTWIRLPLARAAYWQPDSIEEHPDFMAAVRPALAAATAYDFVVIYDIGNPRSGVSYSTQFEYDARSRAGKPVIVTASSQSGVWLHETLHLLGLPDLYDETVSTALAARVVWMGSWDVMSLAQAQALTAWHRWELGWLADPGVQCLASEVSEVDLAFATPDSNGVQLAVVRTGLQTAIAVELRRSAVTQACTEGVLVYRVDASKPSAEGPLRLLLGGLTDAATFPASCTPSFRSQTTSYRWDAPLDLGPGRGASVTDAASGVKVEVTSKSGDQWRVRVTQPSANGPRPSYAPGTLTLRVTGSRLDPLPYEGIEWVQYDVQMTSSKYALNNVAILRNEGGTLRGSYGLPYGALISRPGPSTVSIWLPARRATGQYVARIAMPDGGYADVTLNHTAR